MKYSKSVVVRHPIVVDDELLSRFQAVIDTVLGKVHKAIASEHEVTEAQLKAISQGKTPRGVEQRAVIHVNAALDRVTPEFSIDFKGGVEVGCGSLEQVTKALSLEPLPVDNVSISVGSYSGTRLKIDLGQYNKASYKSVGDQAEVNDIIEQIRKAIAMAEPEYSVIKTTPSRIIASIAFAILCATSFAIVVFHYQKFLQRDFAAFLLAIGIVFSLMGGGVLMYDLYYRAFPKIEFAYGPAKSRAGAKRTLWAMFFTVILIPIARSLLKFQS